MLIANIWSNQIHTLKVFQCQKNLLVAPVYHAAAAINHFGAIAKGGSKCNS